MMGDCDIESALYEARRAIGVAGAGAAAPPAGAACAAPAVAGGALAAPGGGEGAAAGARAPLAQPTTRSRPISRTTPRPTMPPPPETYRRLVTAGASVASIIAHQGVECRRDCARGGRGAPALDGARGEEAALAQDLANVVAVDGHVGLAIFRQRAEVLDVGEIVGDDRAWPGDAEHLVAVRVVHVEHLLRVGQPDLGERVGVAGGLELRGQHRRIDRDWRLRAHQEVAA